MVERFSDNFSKKFNCSHKCPTIWNELEIDSNNFLCDWTYTHVCYQNLPSTRNPLWARCEMWHVVCNFWCGKFQARRRVVLRFHTGFLRGEGVFLTQGLSRNQAIGCDIPHPTAFSGHRCELLQPFAHLFYQPCTSVYPYEFNTNGRFGTMD